MPQELSCSSGTAIGLADLVEALDSAPVDFRDPEFVHRAGPLLGRLAANRTFLADLLLAQLSDRSALQTRVNVYSPQVMVLHHVPGRFLIRANIWPSEDEDLLNASGRGAFFYDIPHDHNFSFLTVGYLGSGYWSDYFELDPEAVTGFVGEPVSPRMVERSQLRQGRLLLYRAHVDIHRQLPADDLSVSLNIVDDDPTLRSRPQFGFDDQLATISEILNRGAQDALFGVLARFGDLNAVDHLHRLAARHPSERVRFSAMRALAVAAATPGDAIGLLEAAAASPSAYVAGMSQQHLGRLQRSAEWAKPPV